LVSLPPGYKPVIRSSYPHLMDSDARVWTKLLESEPDAFEKVWYDLRVGEGMKLKPGVEPLINGVAQALTTKRIDVVGMRGLKYYVIEVKPVADMVALGQALCYSLLFAGKYQVKGDIVPAVVCERTDPDLGDAYKIAGVTLFEVG